ncbi:MAG: hypothetical protein AAFV36_03075 [Myxococcota bacterium]
MGVQKDAVRYIPVRYTTLNFAARVLLMILLVPTCIGAMGYIFALATEVTESPLLLTLMIVPAWTAAVLAVYGMVKWARDVLHVPEAYWFLVHVPGDETVSVCFADRTHRVRERHDLALTEVRARQGFFRIHLDAPIRVTLARRYSAQGIEGDAYALNAQLPGPAATVSDGRYKLFVSMSGLSLHHKVNVDFDNFEWAEVF